MVRPTIRAIVPFLLILLQTSCIREDLQECEEEYFVTIKVVDILTGEDITTSGEVGHAGLFIFDANEQLRYTVNVDSNHIRQKIPVLITPKIIGHHWISVWGNLEGYPPETSSGDLFFGITKITGSKVRNEEIIISRKNARMYITVRGLPALYDAADYYFSIDLNNNGYDLKGTPIPHATTIKQNGITLENNDFVSLSSFSLTHTNGNKEDYVTISLYKKRPGTENREDILIASINSDLNGNHIVLPAGQTTNLLIDLCQEINVRVKISPWDKTEQWVEW